MPLTRGSQQAVLVGDHKQLGPLLASLEAKALGADLPLFERLQKKVLPGIGLGTGSGAEVGSNAGGDGTTARVQGGGGGGLAAVLLDTQYRMHPDIAAFPVGHFYDGRLRNGANTPGERAGGVRWVTPAQQHVAAVWGRSLCWKILRGLHINSIPSRTPNACTTCPGGSCGHRCITLLVVREGLHVQVVVMRSVPPT